MTFKALCNPASATKTRAEYVSWNFQKGVQIKSTLNFCFFLQISKRLILG